MGDITFRSEVKGVRMRRDRIVVVLLQKIYVYNFSDFKVLAHLETIDNPLGIAQLSQSKDSVILACPGIQKGQVTFFKPRLRVDTLFICAVVQKKKVV